MIVFGYVAMSYVGIPAWGAGHDDELIASFGEYVKDALGVPHPAWISRFQSAEERSRIFICALAEMLNVLPFRTFFHERFIDSRECPLLTLYQKFLDAQGFFGVPEGYRMLSIDKLSEVSAHWSKPESRPSFRN